ncbi:hypothetical protein BN1095_1860002 [Clostridioides difficile]|uniref:Uncharacterized protein n=1 Tax=Clostridioides difficile TaxID=1496 RepID=A0A069ANN6_CLODI|nr:hypothetical protein BN1095_1860002 [Clostridioides difficile]
MSACGSDTAVDPKGLENCPIRLSMHRAE